MRRGGKEREAERRREKYDANEFDREKATGRVAAI